MIIIDASASGPLLLEDETPPPAEAVSAIAAGPLVAPAHWPLEVANLLLVAERRGRINADERRNAFQQAQSLGVTVTTDVGIRAWGPITALALEHQLTVYDSAYLDQAVRLNATLMTLDAKLLRAAKRCGLRVLTWRPE